MIYKINRSNCTLCVKEPQPMNNNFFEKIISIKSYSYGTRYFYEHFFQEFLCRFDFPSCIQNMVIRGCASRYAFATGAHFHVRRAAKL